jgi:hypothetical protein
MSTQPWHVSHTEQPPTLESVNARWCDECGRMILTDAGVVTPIGAATCAGGDR